MQMILANHSSYPRVGEANHQHGPRHARPPCGGSEVAPAEFEHIDRSAVDEAIREQENAGLDLVTDGQITWADPVSHLLAPLGGVRLDGLVRFLDTNVCFRQPVIEAKLRRRQPQLTSEYHRARLAARVALKAVLTGPYTLARLSAIATTAYRSPAALARELSVILADEVRELAAAGAPVIQIDEPLILRHPGDMRLLRELLEPLHEAARDRCELAVATYFADAAPLYAQLNSLPADIIGLDFASSPALAEAVADTGASKVLALGIVDGRRTEMECPDAVARTLERVLHRYVQPAVHLQPSCGLGHLRRERAGAKLALLPRIRASLTATAPAPR